VTVLWLDDSSDYCSALWTIVHLLWPGLGEDVDIGTLYRTLTAGGSDAD
jgi:hypothetical protein